MYESTSTSATGHASGSLRDPHDVIASSDFSLFDDPEIEAEPAVRHEQRGHLRFVHANADPVAGDAMLRHFEQRAADPVAIADAHLVVGQAVDREVLAKLRMSEIGSAELFFPIAVGLDIIDGIVTLTSRGERRTPGTV